MLRFQYDYASLLWLKDPALKQHKYKGSYMPSHDITDCIASLEQPSYTHRDMITPPL